MAFLQSDFDITYDKMEVYEIKKMKQNTWGMNSLRMKRCIDRLSRKFVSYLMNYYYLINKQK